MSFFLRRSLQNDKINIDDYTSFPTLGDSNIVIGQGSNTVEVPITGDLKLSNIGVTEIVSISNTDTITTTANVLFNSNQKLLFFDANNYIYFNSSNLNLTSSENITLDTGDNNSVYVNSNLRIMENLDVDGNVTVLGNLVVIGTTTTINSNITVIQDPVIEIGTSSAAETILDRGIKGNWYDGGNKTLFFGMDRSSQKFVYIPDATYDSNNGNVVTAGSVGPALFSILEANDTTQATSTSTGALIVSGGAGIASNLYVGGNVVISDNLYVNGNDILETISAIETGNSSIYARVDTLETSNTSIHGRVDTLETGNTAIYGRVDTLETGNTAIYTRVDTLETGNTAIYARVDTLETGNTAIYARVDTLETSNTTIFGRVDTLETSNTTLFGRVDTLETGNTAIYTRVDTLETGNTAIYTRVDTLETGNTAIYTRVDTLETSNTTIFGRVDTLETGNTAIYGRVDTLETSNTTIFGRVDTLETGNTAIYGRVDTLETSNTTIFGRVDTLETGNTAIYTRVDTLETSNTTLFGRVDTLETGNTTIYARVDTLETSNTTIFGRVDTLETGNTAIYGRVDTLETSNTAIYSRVDILETGNTAIYTRVDTLENNVSNVVVNNSNLDISAYNNINLTAENGKSYIYSDLYVSENMDIIGNVNIVGNLVVSGTTTTVNSNITIIQDPVIEIGTSSSSDTTLDRGIKGNWYDGGNKTLFFGMDRSSQKFVYIPDATYDSNNGNVVTAGSAGPALFSILEANDTTQATSTTTGALIVSGGAGIASNLYVGGNVVITDNLYVNGTNIINSINTLETGNTAIYGRVDTLETGNTAIYARVDTLETSNTDVYSRLIGLESNVSNIVLNGSNLDILSYGNINLNTTTGTLYIDGTAYSAGGGADLPVLGDANIYIGDGTQTSQVTITGDITLSNTGVTQLIAISNTSTIVSSANIELLGTKQLIMDSGNITMKYGGATANLDIASTGNINIDGGNIYLNGTDINDLGSGGGGSITGITYSAPHLFIESASGNVVIDAASNLNLSKHVILSNTFTLSQSNVWSNLSGSHTITLDFNQGSDFYLTLASGANITFNSPTNVNRVGQQGSIIFKNPSSGSTHEVNWASGGSWYFPSGLAPQLTTTNDTIDIFSYIVVEPSIILVNDATNFQQY